MKSLKIIPLLDSIPKFNSYSNYGLNLEKIFKMNSLKYLIHTLKFRKEFHKQLKNEFSNSIKIKEEYDIFDWDKKQKKINEEPEEDIFSLPISKSESKLKIKPNNIKSFFFHKKNKNGLDADSLAFKYNPNYNSIFKNVPSVRIYKPFLENKKNLFNTEIKNNFSSSNIIKNNKNKEIIFNKEKSINKNKYLNTINIYKKFKYQKSLKNQRIRYRNITQNTFSNNNNKSFKSSESSNRFITEIPIQAIKKLNKKKLSLDKLPELLNQKVEEKNTSINSIDNNNKVNTTPFHYKNRAIDFNKMSSRKTKIFKNTLHIPNFGYYEPKFNLVEKRQYNIFFNKKPETDKYRQKKNLLKKILTSYDVEPNYQTIDNNKLNNEVLRRFNWLK